MCSFSVRFSGLWTWYEDSVGGSMKVFRVRVRHKYPCAGDLSGQTNGTDGVLLLLETEMF
jgi:hypothetical protein